MVAKVVLKRIWRSGIVSMAVLAAVGSVGGRPVHSHSDRALFSTIKQPALLTKNLGSPVSKQPEIKVRTLVSHVSFQQIDRPSTADSGALLLSHWKNMELLNREDAKDTKEENRRSKSSSTGNEVTGNVYSQFRKGPSTPGTQPPASGPTNPSGNQKVFQAKIKRRAGGTPVIDVVFNGNKTFEMIVDTGASGTLITQRMATALGVKTVRTERAGIADGSVVEFPIGRVQSIGVGGAQIKNVEVAIAKQMEIGLLGHDFFGNYDVKIKKDVVEFYVR